MACQPAWVRVEWEHRGFRRSEPDTVPAGRSPLRVPYARKAHYCGDWLAVAGHLSHADPGRRSDTWYV